MNGVLSFRRISIRRTPNRLGRPMVRVRVRVFHGSFRVQQIGLLPVMVIEFGTAVYRIA